MLTLYPSLKTYAEHTVDVGTPYSLYVEESGNPRGVPVLFLNDGPGLGSEPYQRCFFDPAAYRIILFDPRGTGRSKPHGELAHNTTSDLLSDIEAVRNYLHIEQWVIFASGWGTTLALLYALENPKQIVGLILQSIFLGRIEDYYHALQTSRALFPDYWQIFAETVEKTDSKEVLNCYFDRLTGADDLLRMAAAKSWAAYFAKCSTLECNPKIEAQYTQPFIANCFARIACHYLVNQYFLTDNPIFKKIQTLKYIPGIIIHGRYDMINSCENAWTLHQHWPEASLKILRCSGHSLLEPATIHTAIGATTEILKVCVA